MLWIGSSSKKKDDETKMEVAKIKNVVVDKWKNIVGHITKHNNQKFVGSDVDHQKKVKRKKITVVQT